MNSKIRLGMIGGGKGSLIGILHRLAAAITEDYELIGGVFNSTIQRSIEFTEELQLDTSRVYENVETMVKRETALPAEKRIQAVTVATPNFLHYEALTILIRAGFHIICEKPITITVKEAIEVEKLVRNQGVVFGVAHTYTGYPMVRQMREMVEQGRIGKLQKVDAQYYQGWINSFLHNPENRKEVWRLDPAKSGVSCCMGDIGVHAFNMIEYVTQHEVERVLADLDTMYEDNPLDVDGTVLIRLQDGTRGIIRASQIATGEENNMRIALYGDKGALRWEQENPNYLEFLQDGEPARILKPGNVYSSEFAKSSVKLPAGHPEGIFDAMGNIYKGVALAIREKKHNKGAYPGMRDGLRGMKFIETVVSSSKEGNIWKTIN